MKVDEHHGLLVPSIDGNTPLGFLAALGVLQILADAKQVDQAPPRLAWQQLDAWRPIVYGVESIEALAEVVLADASRWNQSALLGFQYVKQEKQGPKPVGGLKAPLAVVRAWSRARRDAQDEASLAFVASLFCDGVTETNKKPATLEQHQSAGISPDPDVDIELTVDRTFLDFTARNAQFLEQVNELRGHLTLERIHNALESGAADYNAPRTLDWDPSSDTPGAIYTGFRRGFLPVHEWLGFRALRLFPLASRCTHVRMTACTGRRLDGAFTWPLWEKPATIDSVYALLGYPQLAQLTPDERSALGVSALLCAGLTKKADGYTGTFAPARPA